MINNARSIDDGNGQRFFGEKGAAGCIFLSQKTGRLMLGQRSENVMESGTWGTWGGAIEEGSNPHRTAYDEMFEETGHEGPIKLEPLYTFTSPNGSFSYHNFVAIVEDEFEPWNSHESSGHKWFEAGDWPEPLHFGMYDLIGDIPAMERLSDLVQRAKAGENLLKDAPLPERTLYHCLYREPEGDALLPTLERTPDEFPEKLLFATPYISKALAFAFSYHHGGEIIENGPVVGTPDEYAIICDRDRTLAADRHVRVFAFSSEGFQPLGHGSRQYVSRDAVPFDKTKVVLETTNVDDLMRGGLQIFSTDKTKEQLLAENFRDIDGPHLSQSEWLNTLIKDHNFKWENDVSDNTNSDKNPNMLLRRSFTEFAHKKPEHSQDYTPTSTDGIRKFYHSSPYEIQRGVLNPTTKNIALTSPEEGRTIATFTEYDDANVPYLFATDNPQLSMTYTVPKGIRLMNLHGHGGTEILFLDQESLVGDPDLKGGMYSFESDNFSQIHCDGEAVDQWVSDQKVNLRGAVFTPVRSINDVLKAGVQIYQLNEGADYNAQKFQEEMAACDDQQILSRINGLIEEGKLRWLNQERGINPINCLEPQKTQTSAAATVRLPAPA